MSVELASRDQALAHVRASICRLGPPRLIGAELEWATALRGRRPSERQFAAALGQHSAEAEHRPLRGGSRVSIEPGGQIELSSDVFDGPRPLCAALAADQAELAELLGDIEMREGSMDLRHPPRRILRKPRYAAMEARFARISPLGTVMMCNTSAVQVSVDCGADEAEAEVRWRLLLAAGPALAAAFADSPSLPGGGPGGGPEGGPGGWASQRLRAWLELDPARTGFERGWSSLADYAGWVLDAPLLCVRRDGDDWTAPEASFADWMDGAALGLGAATAADLDYHLSTLFPPVRPCGHFEVRYLDAQPGGLWRVPIAAVDALLSGPGVIARAGEISAPTGGRWRAAARDGLGDTELREAATSLLELASAHAGDEGLAADLTAAALRCKRGLRPSEED